jgi:hypothetical protein
MLDSDVIASLLKDPSITRTPRENEGEVRRLMRDLAFEQLNYIAARDVYKSYGYLDASLRSEDLKGPTIEGLANAFYARMSAARSSIPDVTKDGWAPKFIAAVADQKQTLLMSWEAKWPDLCDGKRLISDLHKASAIKMSESSFKARIVRGMREASSENWRLVRDMLNELIAPAAH